MARSWANAGSATDADGTPTTVAVALGSNLGDREAHLAFAVERLAHFLQALRVSAFHHTAPEGVGEQPEFLNAAAVGETLLAPRPLLEALQSIERERGRERPHWGAARTLDLDLVLHGTAIVDEPGLQVPHPRFRTRRFVLMPLAEVARDLRDPVSGLSVGELLRRLGA